MTTPAWKLFRAGFFVYIFAEKLQWGMKGKVIIAAALLPQFFFLGGCEPFGDLGLEGRPRAEINLPLEIHDIEPEPEGTATYVTAFEYPDGYDYIRDTLHGAGAKVVLYRDGEKVVSAPADGLVPDECRIVAGRLFSVLRSGGGTGILCDGEPLFSYPGEESVEGMIYDGESVLTLGLGLSGGGLCLRKDGEVLFSAGKGVPVGPADGDGPLRMDEGESVFFYGEPLVSAGGDGALYYMVRDGEATQLGLPEGVSVVFDAVSVEGDVYVVATVSGSEALLHEGSVNRLAGIVSGLRASGLRLVSRDSQLFVTGLMTSTSGKTYRAIWDSSGRLVFRMEIRGPNWIYPAPGGYYYVERRVEDVFCLWGQSVMFSRLGRFWSSRCAVSYGGEINVAVVAPDGGTSTVFRSDGTEIITLKGVITQICRSALILPEEDPG